MKNHDLKLSKLMSYGLRHRPDELGLELDPQGWVSVEALLVGLRARGKQVDRVDLERVVRDNDKQRFAFSDDGLRIRANQGHSVKVDLGYAPRVPPDVLFHGTATRFLDSILEQGLLPRGRHHVHLSADLATARTVGARHGKPVILEVAAGRLHAAGQPFWISDNGVWLAERVAPRALTVRDGAG